MSPVCTAVSIIRAVRSSSGVPGQGASCAFGYLRRVRNASRFFSLRWPRPALQAAKVSHLISRGGGIRRGFGACHHGRALGSKRWTAYCVGKPRIRPCAGSRACRGCYARERSLDARSDALLKTWRFRIRTERPAGSVLRVAVRAASTHRRAVAGFCATG